MLQVVSYYKRTQPTLQDQIKSGRLTEEDLVRGIRLSMEEFGIGTDFNVSSKPAGNLVDDWVGNLYVRLPLGNSGLAPYAFGGGGRAFSPVYDWVYGGGVGLEFRFNPTTGIFGDARFLWSDKSTELNRLLIRAGLRLVF